MLGNCFKHSTKKQSSISCTEEGHGASNTLSSLIKHIVLSSVPYLGKVMLTISSKMSMSGYGYVSECFYDDRTVFITGSVLVRE